MEASTAPQPDVPGVAPEVAAALSPEAQAKIIARSKAREAAAAEKEANAGSAAQTQTSAVRKVSDDEETTEEELLDATAWFLSEEEDEDVEQEISVNLGTNSRPKKLAWVIKPVDAAVLRRARSEARMGTRAQKRAGTAEMDDAEFHKRVVVAGTVEPALLELAGSREKALERLERRFKVKPLLITQISNEIVSLSGLDDEDIQEVETAGN